MQRGVGVMAWLAGMLLLLAHGAACVAQSAPETLSKEHDFSNENRFRVALVTAAPGSLYWERFGHNAILIEDRVAGTQRMYNFGWFDFEQENFMLNFVRGRMLYQLAVTDPQDDLANYRSEDRSVWLQELNLNATQAERLSLQLEHDAQPEFAEYRYDYYQNNCSTKVRDALDAVLDGTLQKQSVGRGRGETWRSLSLLYAEPIEWLALGIHLGLGPAADRRINFWEEAFLPLRLRDLVREIEITDAAGNTYPLVRNEYVLFAGALDDRLTQRPTWLWTFLILGLGGSTAIGVMLRGRRLGLRKLAAVSAVSINIVVGLIGLGLLALWFGTDHEIAWRNANIGLFLPLCLALTPALWRLRNPAYGAARWSRWLAAIVFSSALTTLTAWLLKFNIQTQGAWMALCLPWHLMIWLVLQPRERV